MSSPDSLEDQAVKEKQQQPGLGEVTRIPLNLQPDCRPIGAKSYMLDFFHWNFTLGFVLITLTIVLSVALKNPVPRLAAFPLVVNMYQTSIQLVICIVLLQFKAKYPFRFSSMTKGEPIRPGIYSIVEDMVAVDGGQGTDFRRRLDARYKESPEIRSLLAGLQMLWGLTGLILAAALTAMIVTIDSIDAVYAIGKQNDVLLLWSITKIHTRMDGSVGLGSHTGRNNYSLGATNFKNGKFEAQ
ncbi:MAG: hypothetical protein Q9227_000496 [Pyrenula ochraceoflavens]